jgi:hypothetical protein
MHVRLNIAIFVGILAGAFLSLGLAGSASASSTDDWSHAPAVIPGNPCGHVGDKGTHGGERYECTLKHGQDCPRWTWKFNPDTPKSGKTAWPHPSCPCVSTSVTASPSASPTVTPSPTVAPSPSDTTTTQGPLPIHSTAVAVGPVGPLPVTGSPVVALGSLGGALLALGGLALYAARERARRTVRP